MILPALSLWQPWASLCVEQRNVRHEEWHRVEGGAVSCGWCYRTFTFNFMRDQGPYRCSCRAAVEARAAARRPWKTIETRSWRAPKSLLGQRIAIHATLTKPGKDDVDWEYIGDDCDGFEVGLFTVSWPRRRAECPPRMYDEVGTSSSLPLGAVVGTAVLADCVPMVDFDLTGESNEQLHGSNHLCIDGSTLMLFTEDDDLEGVDVSDQIPFGRFEPDLFGWLLTDARKLVEPVPARGRPGNRLWQWEVPEWVDLGEERP